MAIIGIVAVAENYAIGKDGKLPWHYSADLKHFKKTTTGNAVVMGFRTWKSLGRPLPDRLNIVLTTSNSVAYRPCVIQLSDVDDVLALSSYLSGDLFIMGGAKTYEAFAEHIETWIVTRVPINVDDADTFMPADFLDGFELTDSKMLEDGLKVETFRRI